MAEAMQGQSSKRFSLPKPSTADSRLLFCLGWFVFSVQCLRVSRVYIRYRVLGLGCRFGV